MQPAAVFISGDLFDGPEANPDTLVEPWRKLSAPAGIFYVTGNHEEFTDRTELIGAVQHAGIRVLNNEKVNVHGLQIVGVHDRETGDPRKFRTLLRQAELDGSRASILLAHQPSSLAIASVLEFSIAAFRPARTAGQILAGDAVRGTRSRAVQKRTESFRHTARSHVQRRGPRHFWQILRVGTNPEIVLIRLAVGKGELINCH